ncbi:glycosyltransferase family 4 protein [Lacticaseibacillus paracasei]|uniref:glycosyltransferase family 4 protein n=2 Tax=Lacticaseibacillus paracasei TaxID=1597 RepID=UPI0021A66048|nr:glycosyltransferase family 4 protein [Lacticaseibacillus paracasei]
MINERISVAMIGQKRIPSRNGGIEKVLTELCPRLVSRGVIVTAFNRKNQTVSQQDLLPPANNQYMGVRLKTVLTIPTKGLSAMSSSFFGAIEAALSSYDIVHFHAEGPSVMLGIAKIFGKKCVVTIHGLDWKRDKWKGTLGKWYILLGEHIAAKYADEIIVLNMDTKDYFEKKYHRTTHFIPNGVNQVIPERSYDMLKNFSLEPNGYFLSLSRLTPEKGIHTLIKAFRKTNSDIKLVIAGGLSDSSNYVQYLRNLSKGDNRIIFTGFVGGKMLSELYSHAYVYVLPSSIEGMPLTLLEAMAYGNAVACTNITELREIVGNAHALTFNPDDVEGLQGVLQRFLDDPIIQRSMRQSSSDFIQKKFNWNDIVDRTISVYHEALSKGK